MFSDAEKTRLSAETTWCPYPFQQLMLSPTAEVRPCCRFIAPAQGDVQHWNQKGLLTDFYKNDYFESIRQLMSSNLPVPGCGSCYAEERSGIHSMRQKAIFEFRDPSLLEITGIEIGVGRVCNLKCRTCDANYSTKWEAENKASGLDGLEGTEDVDLDFIPLEQLTHLQEIKVTGGEPFMHPKFLKMLNRLVTSGQAAGIDIEIFSNCTRRPPENTLNDLAGFRSVKISLSIDAVGIRNHYVRHPARWEDVESVFDFWLSEKAIRQNLSVRTAATFSIFNILYVFELLEWILRRDPHHRVIFQLVHSPRHLSVSSFPARMKAAIVQHLRARETEFRKQFKISLSNQNNLEKVYSFASHGPSIDGIVQEFMAITASLDRIRGENFALTFPELAKLIRDQVFRAEPMVQNA